MNQVHQKLRLPELSGVLKKKRSHAKVRWLKGDAAFVTKYSLFKHRLQSTQLNSTQLNSKTQK
jgi:hypothetical protein